MSGLHAVRIGLRRGWIEYVQSLRSSQDQTFYAVVAVLTVGYLWLRRNTEVDAPLTSFAQASLPSLLALVVVFGLVVGPMFNLSLEREDGTLLRARAVPRGVTGYVTGQLLFQSLSIVPAVVIVLVPTAVIFDGVVPGTVGGWLRLVAVIALGLLAVLPIGMAVGAVVPNAQKAGTWGMLPTMGLAAISGIFFPIEQLWGWVQGVAQVFPMYWIGLGMRAAFLPDEAAAFELYGSWRTTETVLVLAAWAVAGALVAPRVLRRMARRQSGAGIAEARDAAAQWVR